MGFFFQNVTFEISTQATTTQQIRGGQKTSLQMGWALSTPRTTTRFPDHVRAYLMNKFEIGEKTGLKVTPDQVAADMRQARKVDGERSFRRDDWR